MYDVNHPHVNILNSFVNIHEKEQIRRGNTASVSERFIDKLKLE